MHSTNVSAFQSEKPAAHSKQVVDLDDADCIHKLINQLHASVGSGLAESKEAVHLLTGRENEWENNEENCKGNEAIGANLAPQEHHDAEQLQRCHDELKHHEHHYNNSYPESNDTNGNWQKSILRSITATSAVKSVMIFPAGGAKAALAVITFS